MPIVPRYDALQVAPGALPTPRFQAPELPDVADQQIMQAGKALQQAGTAGARVVGDMQAEANALRVDDALNRAKEAALRLTYDKDLGYTNVRGLDALQRQSGKPLADEYAENLQKELAKLTEGLGNDAQRAAFGMRANDLVTQFRGQATAHEATEFKSYHLSVREGTISTRMQEIGLRYNDPAAIDEAVTSIRAATYDQARLLGKSAEWAEAQARKMTSNAHRVALSAAIEKNDIAYADGYLKKYAGQMEADDVLRAQGLVTKEMNQREGVAAAAGVIASVVPRMMPTDMDRLVGITLQSESGGRRYGPDGKLLTSPAGARGEMQVMPGTQRDPGYGVKPAKDDSPEELARVGRDYLAAMVQRYGGDVGKAWAAYNAGPGALDKALAQAERSAKLAANDPSVRAFSWMEFMPKETQAYVAKNLKAYETGQGAPARPTLAELEDRLRQNPALAANPDRLKVATAELSRRYGEIDKAIKQREDEAVADAMRAVQENGGRFTDLPASIRSRIPADKVDQVMNYAQKIAKGDDTTSPLLYAKLSGDPAFLRSLSDAQFFALRRELSEGDFRHFANERAKLLNPNGTSNGPGDLNSGAIKSALDDRMRMMRLDPTPKDGSGDAERIGTIRKFVADYFLNAQREAGKKFTDTEVSQHIDALFAKNATFRGFFSNSTGPMLGMKAGDIDGATRDRIKAAFRRQGVDSPSDAQILTAYWNSQVTRR